MLTYLYCWIQFHSIKLVWKLAILLAPTSLIQTVVTKKLEGFGIKVALDYGGTREPVPPSDTDKKFKCEAVIRNRRFFKRFAGDRLLGHGEAYMEGWFDSSDLSKQLQCIAENVARKGKEFGFLRAMWMMKESLDTARNKQTKGRRSLEVADLHYNLGNDLYEAMLGQPMIYTCGFFRDVGDDDLAQAQYDKMELIAKKLKLKPGMKVLDIGAGFGASAKYLAEKHGVSVVAYNISKEQLAYGREICKGLPVTFVEDDYRNATGQFDAVYSIGFFEHVGRHNFREYFEVVDRCLKDDGLHLLHSITLADSTFPRTVEWTNKYIFPNGELPYPQDYVGFAEGLALVEDVHNFGASYAKTLRCWKKNFIANWPQLEPKYGHMQDGNFYRMWIYYLSAAICGFDSRTINLYQVVYSKQGIKDVYGGYDSIR